MSVIGSLLDSGAEWFLIKISHLPLLLTNSPKDIQVTIAILSAFTLMQGYTYSRHTQTHAHCGHMYRNCHAEVRQQLNVSLSSNQGLLLSCHQVSNYSSFPPPLSCNRGSRQSAHKKTDTHIYVNCSGSAHNDSFYLLWHSMRWLLQTSELSGKMFASAKCYLPGESREGFIRAAWQ